LVEEVTVARPGPDRTARLVGQPATRELVPATPGASARWHRHDYPGPYCRWNYHPEYEVHLIQRGTGRYIVGDHIGRFRAGQLVLVGSNLPHDWISDLADGEVISDRDVVFQFHPQWIRACQELMPELCSLDRLLTRAARGLEFSGDTAQEGAEALVAIGAAEGVERLQRILSLLQTMAAAPPHEVRQLANPWVPPRDDRAADVVDDVLRYIFSSAGHNVRMSEAAARVGMSESAFSRYFTRAAGQTFSDTVRKLRLTQASQLLERTDRPVASIAHEAGYQNLSNFNRHFLAHYGCTPSSYRRNHL
jgi:AraC-like DNA-binding protein